MDTTIFHVAGDDPSRSLFWSDQVVSMRTLQPMNGTENNTLQEVPIQSVVTVPEPLSAAPNLFFLDQTDSWFMSTQQVRHTFLCNTSLLYFTLNGIVTVFLAEK